MKFTGNC